MPTTTEELREVLKAFVTGDPNGNGEADEIGLTGATTWNTMVEYCLLGWSFQNIKPDFWLYLTDAGEVGFAARAPRRTAKACATLSPCTTKA